MKKNIIKRMAFTLAEVLIVLGIIGIVAQMTIPTLMKSVQKIQYETGLKKAYTTFNQALIQISADMGCVGDLKCTGLFTNNTQATGNQILGTELVKYFKVIKNCETSASGSSITGCWASDIKLNYDGSGGQYDSTGGDGSEDDYYRFITADGASYFINSWLTDCGTNDSSGRTNNLTQICGAILVDVNGPQKRPNALGRDIFTFLISNGKGPMLYPSGGSDCNGGFVVGWWKNPAGAPVHCIDADKDGRYCTGRIMEEGWEMKY